MAGHETEPEEPAPLNLIAHLVVDAFARDVGDSVQVIRDDARQWLALEEASTGIAFAEAEGDELQIVPFKGNADSFQGLPWVVRIGPSWLDGADQLVARLSSLIDPASQASILSLMRGALDHWTRAGTPAPEVDDPASASVGPGPSDAPEMPVEDVTLHPDAEADEPTEEPEPVIAAQIKADVSEQWSWASSAARVPQIFDLEVSLAEPVESARVVVTATDADITFGHFEFEGPLNAGATTLGSIHVSLSPSVMSRVMDRHSAECSIEVRDSTTDRVLGRMSEAIDVQPRDLWLWKGDPRPARQRHPDLEPLAESLLASFVRPNHPEVAAIAREAADLLGVATNDPSFMAFQLDDIDKAAQRADATVDAIYGALQARRIAYSEPPPGWDYTTEGQRIRDHSDVARAGLGTCMDTTVLTAAVIEHVGLLPLLVLIPGHIFIGYWRRDPYSDPRKTPEWYPDTPTLANPAEVMNLIEGGFLGLIETTAFTVGKEASAHDAREHALTHNVPKGLDGGRLSAIDVAAARRAGVSPLPVVNHRTDGVTEVIEYRHGGSSAVTEVSSEPLDPGDRHRHVDTHPARYRTWKASLFSLNATNDLLNLKNNAKVQPLVLPPAALGVLEDRLHQDVSFSLRSGYDVPVVWQAREIPNALMLLDSGKADDQQELVQQLNDRTVFVQRIGRSKGQATALSPATFFRELRSMAHGAKTAREERGMNPLHLCLGLLRWPHKPGVYAEAPLILVPVNVAVTRGRQDLTLSLDASQHTTPNAALIEWLRREHGLTISGLAEPLTDRAGIDVDGVLSEVRKAVAEAGLALDVRAEARLAMLDLSAFRMWQDLNQHADSFLERPLVRHLVETPTEPFTDPAGPSAGDDPAPQVENELDGLETPIPADSTQKRAVLWARQGRTFVLQGPPGTGKSQTITNMVAECVLAGLRVLFVAEKGTALAVVQRRIDEIGLGPFTLNLHHEGSNATEVRAQLKRALTATVAPDTAAMDNARRRLRNANYELTEYPVQLHETNASGFSAYSAHDQLLVLGDGPALAVSASTVAHQADEIEALSELFQDLQPWTAAAGVRSEHPWRFAGAGNADPFDVEIVGGAVRGVLAGIEWSSTTTGSLRDALDAVVNPEQLTTLVAAADPALPSGADLAGVLQASWPKAATEVVDGCERSVEEWKAKLHGFEPQVLGLDLRAIAAQVKAANESGFIGRKNRLAAAIAPLTSFAPSGQNLTAEGVATATADLIQVQDTASQIRASLGAVVGLAHTVPDNPFQPGALAPTRARLDQLVTATNGLRGSDPWAQEVRTLAENGLLTAHLQQLMAMASSWRTLWDALLVQEADFQAWRSGSTLAEAVRRHHLDWTDDLEHRRLLPLQQWCQLVRKLEPLRRIGLDDARSQLLEGTLPAGTAEEALLRGVARASLSERTKAAGLDRFDAVAHDLRVHAYSEAQREIRRQWVTTGPAQLLTERSRRGTRTGGLARELDKTRNKLGTRPLLRKYGEAVQELTPLVLCSPSSVVDLIEPGVMEFDLVIFDEASQITVPEAVGALGRAKAAIVVGDSKQMPPTRRVGGGPVADEEIDDPDAEEIVEDQESILSECELARVPTLSLSWHYRSQDEELIAFSNRAYYRGGLSSFPTPTLSSSETGVEFRRIDGQYLRSGSKPIELGGGIVAGSNTNPVEAEAIVAFVHELVNGGEALPSVGIVTFNEQQRQLIEEMLYASADPRVSDVMDEAKMGRSEALFVKALEQVQGDERDTIIFSIAFSKQANGKIPTNFGPLSNGGGERRLNVAITRARRKNLVYCSFEPGELDVAGSTFDGPKHLKEFLTFARNAGRLDEPTDTVERVPVRDRHRDDIAKALRDAGLHVRSDVGLSNFRLDLVLSRPESPNRPILPVLLDGETWRRRSTVSDRDVLPVEVLEGLMGWPKVARIWWPMWLQNRDEVIQRVLDEVSNAERRLDGEPMETADGRPEALVPEAPGASADGGMERLTVGVTSTPPIDSAARPASEPRPAELDAPDEAAEPLGELPTQLVPAATPPTEPAPLVQTTVGLSTTPAPLPDSVSVFRPAHSNVVGARTVLDALSDRAAAAIVREQLIDIVETEGPVELGRLARLVARRFGLNAVRASRADDIARLVPRGQVRKSKLGSFAWPAHLSPETWRGYRTVDPDSSRTLDEVAPEEIANAMRAVRAELTNADDDLVIRSAAEAFGIVRLGANVRRRLEAVLKFAQLDALDNSNGAAGISTPPPEAVAASDGPKAATNQEPLSQPTERTGEPTPPPRAIDPAVEELARRADALTSDLSAVDDDQYFDYEQNRQLTGELRDLANQIVLDRECDGDANQPAALRRLAHLSADDARAVGTVASRVWYASVHSALEPLAHQLALRLAEDPEFDPLPWGAWLEDFLLARLDGHRPALIWITGEALFAHAESSGAIRRNEAEVKQAAQVALDRMAPLERDIYGFTSRNARRRQLAEQYLQDIRPTRHDLLIYWMSRFESEQAGALREARYATASRQLAALGETRAQISRILGVSTSVLDRIERENRSDVELAPDDPILTDLAPALRAKMSP